MKQIPFTWLFVLPCFALSAQDLPEMMHLSPDGHRLITGGLASTGFYDESQIQDIEIWFAQPNYLSLLSTNYTSGTDIPATLIINGDTLPSPVGVRYKGQTSYFMNNNTKKSFNLTLDYEDPDQDHEGFTTLNLNCGYLDPSSMREILYLHSIRNHTPAAKGNYTLLSINGEAWGLYENVQQLDDQFINSWFLSDEGTRWRAVKPGNFTPGGPGGGQGGPFGTGYSSLNYLGSDTTEYQDFYTLKKSTKSHPWDDLRDVCDVLENTPLATLEAAIEEKLDLDRTLWFLAQEILYSDDDGYVFKGGMDYYLWWDEITGRMTPLEYDGNTVMEQQNAGWGPFYHQTDDRYPLLYRLLAVPSIRQRYLAHVRTLLNADFTQAAMDERIDYYFDLIQTAVQDDPNAIYSYNTFVSGKDYLKTFVQQKRNLYLNNSEVSQPAPAISDVKWTVNGTDWQEPDPDQTAWVTATVSSPIAGIAAVHLFLATGFDGHFSSIAMYDDGAHSDAGAGDGIYGAAIPQQGNGTYVRFYVEAIANNPATARTYAPAGAEHDVYFFRVGITETVSSDVVVNELMASNTAAVADEAGEYDDWVEFFNTGAQPVDLTGWHLTDSDLDLTQWTFPQGTVLQPGQYLIIWADSDEEQGALHASFKLGADGETLWLIDPELRIAQEIAFDEQETDLSFSRIPNGTGDFIIKTPTFGFNNEATTADETPVVATEGFGLYPNPTKAFVRVVHSSPVVTRIDMYDALGHAVYTSSFSQSVDIDVSLWPEGIYIVRVGNEVKKLVVQRDL